MASGYSRSSRRVVFAAAIAAAVLGLVAADGLLRFERTFAVPLPAVARSEDPGVLARGAYLVWGPGRCADCHGAVEQRQQMLDGLRVPLSGGFSERIPLGVVTFPNLTSDVETGIGAMSDGEVARALLTGVTRDGRIGLPFKELDRYRPSDVVAVVSYLRSLPPEHQERPKTRYNLLGRLAKAWLLRPPVPREPYPDSLEPGPTAAYGRYLAEVVAGCRGCHTKRSMWTGVYTGEPYAGGFAFELPDLPGVALESPNLTPDPATGRIALWSEDQFVERLRAGRRIEGSPMPWGPYEHIAEDDARALYRFFQSLEPAALGAPARDRLGARQRAD